MNQILQFHQSFPQVQTEHGQVIHQAVLEGMCPFRPNVIEMELYYDIDFNVHWLHVDIRHTQTRLPSGLETGYWRFSHKEKIDEDVMIFDPYKETHRLALLMRDAFRFRDTLSNDHGHHLGEE